MKSPRFDIRAAHLKKIFQAKNLVWTWKEKVRNALKGQYLSDAIEHLDFHINRDVECQKLSERILAGDYFPSQPQRVLVEKSKGLCRQLVVPSLADALVLQCLSDAFNSDIKAKAPTKKAFYEPKDHSFSKVKKKGADDGYGTFQAWMNFQQEIFKFSETRSFIVVTDIANYYDFISYVHLRNIVASMVDGEECVLDMLIFVLSGLLWQPDYMPRIEVGLPQIDMDAPRVLAHCFLYELDALLESKNLDFARFMDDIDVGVDTIPEAKSILREIDLLLQTRQVRLNSGKTKILTREEAALHFRISENIELDQLEASSEIKKLEGTKPVKERKKVRSLLVKGLQKGAFDEGNGEKIIKRLLTLSRNLDIQLPDETLFRILRRWPGCQTNVLQYVSHRPLSAGRAEVIIQFLDSGIIVDDVSYLSIAHFVTDIRIRSVSEAPLLEEIWESIPDDTYCGFYSRAWLGSKYLSTVELLEYVQNRRGVWARDYRLGRLVGALYCRFKGTDQHDAFASMVRRSRNTGARETMTFHHLLSTDLSAVHKMLPMLKKSNDSRPNGITHPKSACLTSVLSNALVKPQLRDTLLEANSKAWGDVYYRKEARRVTGLKKLPTS